MLSLLPEKYQNNKVEKLLNELIFELTEVNESNYFSSYVKLKNKSLNIQDTFHRVYREFLDVNKLYYLQKGKIFLNKKFFEVK
jgi:hypothetical protein